MKVLTRRSKLGTSTKTARPARRTIDGKVYGNVFEVAKLLDVHWTRVYALLREGRLDAAKVLKEGRATWIRLDALKSYQEAREFWIGLHTSKEAAVGGGR